VAAYAQYAGLLLFAFGVGLVVGVWSQVAGVGCSLIVLGVGVLAFGVAAEREVTDGSSSTAARPHPR
jgi:hypothetical protein